MRLGALLLLNRSCALTDHSSRFYLRVLRASPSCICVRILALQCCRQAIADVWPHRRLSRCSQHCKRWDQAYRDRPALPRNDNNTSTEWSAYATLLEGGMDFPLASWLETVRPARCNRSKSLCRGTSPYSHQSPNPLLDRHRRGLPTTIALRLSLRCRWRPHCRYGDIDRKSVV